MKPISILQTEEELLSWRKNLNSQLGFVPTMGSLHKGHCELIKSCKNSKFIQTPEILVSIFVNPLQFSPDEDFDNYPRDLQKDIQLAEKFGASAIWAPKVKDLFPNGTDNCFKIQPPTRLTKNLCGSKRIGHFDGVATVIFHLLKVVKPEFLILGEKDWQQFVIIKNLLKTFNFSTKLRGVPTVRDQDGLAFSSRNSYLSKLDRSIACFVPNTLEEAALEFSEKKTIDLRKIHSTLEEKGLKVDYLEVVEPYKLQQSSNEKSISLLATAVFCNGTRLIDHKFLMTRKPIVAIDGPAGAGKSTVTRSFADKLGLTYLDTGAMYRAVTWLVQNKNIIPEDENQVREVLKGLKLELKASKEKGIEVIVNGVDVTKEIRSPKVTSKVSIIASHSSVRSALTMQQKSMGNNGGLVAEGRDIGTAVFPKADLKIFLTATTKERARRRLIDLTNKGYRELNLLDLEKEIKERDYIDSTRKISPLIKADDAIEIVSDGMTIDEVVNKIYEEFRSVVPEEVWPTP